MDLVRAMSVGETAVVALGTLIALGAWAFMFLPGRSGLWPRTWIAAGTLGVTAVAGLAATGRLDEVMGPLTATEVLLGLAVGFGWLLVTHVGARLLTWLFPTFGDQVRELYALNDDDVSTASKVGPVMAMGVAEELLFRGLLHGLGGLLVGLVVYAAVQVVQRNWALVLAALCCGAVWGAMYEWRAAIWGPIIAHVLWTAMLTFVFPLPATVEAGERQRVGRR